MSVMNFEDAIKNAREPLPMEPEIWAAGADIETAHCVARILRQRGYYLVRADDIGWDDIKRFQAELDKGQSIYEDAGGCFSRAIMALFGKQPDPVVTHQDAVRALLEGLESESPSDAADPCRARHAVTAHDLAEALRGIVGGAGRVGATSQAQSRAHVVLTNWDRQQAGEQA